METTDGTRERLRLAAGGGEASVTGPTLFATEPAAATALEPGGVASDAEAVRLDLQKFGAWLRAEFERLPVVSDLTANAIAAFERHLERPRRRCDGA
jgi:hypothetical protein